MQLLDAWYVVALSSEVLADRPTVVQFHGQDFVLWRDTAGQVAVLLDRCPHKGAALSSGLVRDGQIHCGYHGWCFGRDGHCLSIPAQHTGEPMPHRAHIPAVPSREAYGFVWIWWARDPQAPQANLPPLPEVGPLPDDADPNWRHLEGEVVWQANWLRVLEAFMDLTHAPFVHSGSFGAMAADQLMPEEHWVRADSLYERVLAPRDRHYRADQGRGLRAWFNSDANAGTSDETSAGDGVQHIQLWLANVSLVRVVFGDFQISLCTAHVPMADGQTRNLWRHFRSFLRTPLADGNARGRVERFMAEDQRMVETLKPLHPDLDGRGDLLLASDAMTLGLRKLLREKRAAGLLL